MRQLSKIPFSPSKFGGADCWVAFVGDVKLIVTDIALLLPGEVTAKDPLSGATIVYDWSMALPANVVLGTTGVDKVYSLSANPLAITTISRQTVIDAGCTGEIASITIDPDIISTHSEIICDYLARGMTSYEPVSSLKCVIITDVFATELPNDYVHVVNSIITTATSVVTESFQIAYGIPPVSEDYVPSDHTHVNYDILNATNAPFTVSQALAISNNTLHINVKSGNPHMVTKAEVGLGNVPNTDFTAAVAANTAHAAIISGNPHNVTKYDVGLSNVPNVNFTLDINNSIAHINTLIGNPHQVTKADVGLGDVPNTDFTIEVTANTAARHTHDNKAILDDITAAFTIEKAEAIFDNTAHRLATTGNPHQVTKADVGLSEVPNVDCTNASNITTGTLPSSVLPPAAIVDVFVVGSEAEMLALTVQKGDIAVRTDLVKSFINYTGYNVGVVDWQEILSPTSSGSGVLAVNGKTGVVILTTSDIGEGANLYYTEARVSQNADVMSNTANRHAHINKTILDATTASFTVTQASAIQASLDHVAITSGNPHNVTKAEVGLGNVPNTDFTASVAANTAHTNTIVGNPHQVTKADVGLSEVPNHDFTAEIAANTAKVGITPEQAAAIVANTTHAAIVTGNPHMVTKAEVGLSEVPNVDFTAAIANNTAHTNIIVGNPHQVTKADVGLSNVPNVDCTNASNITSGTLPTSVLPALSVIDTFVVGSEAEMLALTVQKGDIAVRTDIGASYINITGDNLAMTDWQELAVPTNLVLSVNGQTGVVVLTTTNVSEGANLYYTEARVSANTDVALNTAARHTHANKAILDATTASFTTEQVAAIVANTAKVGITPEQAAAIIANTAHAATVTGNPHQVTKAEVGLGNVPNVNPLVSPTFTGTVTIDGNTITNIKSVAVDTIDCSLGNCYEKTVDGNVAFNFTNVPTNCMYGLTLIISHISGTISWPTNVKWSNGLAPVFDANHTHMFMFVTRDGGITWLGTSHVNYAL